MSTFTQPDSVGVNDLPLTTQITEEIAPGFILNDVDRQIVKIRPMATPLDQISRSGRARSTRTIEVKYYAVDLKDAATQTAAAIAANSMDVVDGQVSCSIAMKNARIFSQTDTFMIADTSSAPGGENMLFYVTEVSGDKVSAILINARVSDEGTFQHAAIPAEAKVVRMARAASELDVQSPQYQALPRSKSNNCQIFKIQVEESTLQRLAPNQAGWTFSDQEEIAVSDMRMGMERSFLFGSRAKIHDLEKLRKRPTHSQLSRAALLPGVYRPERLARESALCRLRTCRRPFEPRLHKNDIGRAHRGEMGPRTPRDSLDLRSNLPRSLRGIRPVWPRQRRYGCRSQLHYKIRTHAFHRRETRPSPVGAAQHRRCGAHRNLMPRPALSQRPLPHHLRRIAAPLFNADFVDKFYVNCRKLIINEN